MHLITLMLLNFFGFFNSTSEDIITKEKDEYDKRMIIFKINKDLFRKTNLTEVNLSNSLGEKSPR